MKLLQSRLYEQELRKREEAAHASSISKGDNGWETKLIIRASPIPIGKRSAQGVRLEMPYDVLDGDIEKLIESCLSDL